MKILNFFFFAVTIIVINSCKKDNTTKNPTYFISFNDGIINKTYDASVIPYNIWSGLLSCGPQVNLNEPNVGINGEFDFKIFLKLPKDSASLMNFKLGNYQVFEYNSSQTLYTSEPFNKPPSLGSATGGVKYAKNTPLYTSNNFNNSNNSINRINKITFLDRVFDNIYNTYFDRFIIEGEYKINCTQNNSTNQKTFSGNYKFLMEVFSK
jgi:hypothetical protein